ncbi:hypothetical protein NX773_14575 [Massilia solisilvae]|uniref:Harpin HrpZ n=1 Tax=Massilia solisilvae TaxID=1811225 RepID=A0ABT2BNC2_9BURK|nr:hypothetical protein [Massilia solisilvae]MCS0609393.1 hypothetical protein [Massilia solisilvae]
MSISSISSSLSSLTQTSQLGSASRASADDQAQQVQGGAPPRPHGGGGLGKAVMQSLADTLGIDTSSAGGASATDGSTSTAASTAGTTDVASAQQALGSFMQSLMSALHAQGAGASASSGTNGRDPDGDGDGHKGPRMGQGGPGRMESDLQSLIQKLASSSTGTSTSSDSTTSSHSTPSDSGTSTLQDSFKNLLSALGVSTDGSSDKLNSFLQSLQSKMADVHPAGNAVNTSA